MTNMDGSDEFAEVDMTEAEFDRAMTAGEPVTATSWRDNLAPADAWRTSVHSGGTVTAGEPARGPHITGTGHQLVDARSS